MDVGNKGGTYTGDIKVGANIHGVVTLIFLWFHHRMLVFYVHIVFIDTISYKER